MIRPALVSQTCAAKASTPLTCPGGYQSWSKKGEAGVSRRGTPP
jgi:hypothetical protein